ncbi:hypothetical protein A5881_003861 [Enterococcus termitis]
MRKGILLTLFLSFILYFSQTISMDVEAEGVNNKINQSVDVSDWKSLIRAMSNPSISMINVVSDFAAPDNILTGLEDVASAGWGANNTSGSAIYLYLNKTAISRKLTIEGNGHTIDFGGAAITFQTQTASTNSPWDITWKNLKTYHGNFYGFTTLRDLGQTAESKSKLTYENIIDVGNQVIHSEYGNVFISGEFKSTQMAAYTSKFRSNFKINATDQTNFYVSKLTINDNANVELSTINAGNIDLGYNDSGDLTIGNNVNLTVTANGTAKNAYEARGANVYITNGSVNVGVGSNIVLIPQANSSSIALMGTGTQFVVGKDSNVNINSMEHTDSTNGISWSSPYNIIYLANNAMLVVDDFGSLYVDATGMGASNSNIIHVDGAGQFLVQPNGTFNVKSDSTSVTQNLLYFSSSSSTFHFSDAKSVDLERTNPFTDTTGNNGLIGIAGKGGTLDVDIQKVNIWNKNNFSVKPNRSWAPMYGMVIDYAGTTSTVLSARSLTNIQELGFKNQLSGFTTKNVQRVLFEQIPNVSVSILSNMTDNVTSTDSTTIIGTTNPGAYVRLSDKPIIGSVGVLIDPAKNSVKSPVTSSGQDSLYTNNFTVQADASGKYSYTLPEGKHFSAGTTITAYSFLDGKTATATKVVLDVTSPKGEPKDYDLGKGETKPDPGVFVQNPTDTNPVAQNYTYKYTTETLGKIDTFVSTVGEHEVKVIVMDDAKNETVVTSKLIVHQTTNGIDGQDIIIEPKTIKVMTEAQLKKYILSQSNVSAHKIVGGTYTDLTDKIQVTDLAGLSSSKTSGTYPVILTVKAADSGLATDITKVVQVTVKLSEQNVKVRFVDEAGETLSTTVTVKGNVGSTIDLTKEKQVIDTIASVLTNRYILEKSGRPTNETAVPVGMEESTITYTFQGTLSIYSGPTEINFGTHEVSWKGTKDNNPSYDQPLVIWDNRKNLSNWKLSVKLESELSMPSSPTHVLSGSLSYQTISDKKILSTEAQDVLQAKHDTSGQYDISTRTWGPDKQGLRLDVPSGAVKLTGEYETTLIWRVEEAY